MTVYVTTNRGLSDRSFHQQTTRFLLASVLAILPMSVCGFSILKQPAVILSEIIALLWMITYPLLFHLTNRRVSVEYDNKIDVAFGLYLFGMLTAIQAISQGNLVVDIIMSVIDFILLFIPAFQIGWYVIYHTCVDANGIKIIQETNINECIEYVKSFSPWKFILIVILIALLAVIDVLVNISQANNGALISYWKIIVCAIVFFIILHELLKNNRGALWNVGIVELYMTVKDYVNNNRHYKDEQEKRLKGLKVKPLNINNEDKKPKTIIMIIGESACRDYMSAWNSNMKHDTTPWIRHQAETNDNAIVFSNAYSCAIQTVPSLEKALTEANQYNNMPFYESCSIVDIAHKLGYHVYWYSNQGHLGSADTPVTLVAETSDVAKWTKQEVGKVQYDENLLDFLDEVDPTKNNFVVIHLKGSHFNYLNRYPESFTRWGKPGVQDDLVNYENSIAYTDSVIQRIWEYACKKLNLQALVYFSDHGSEPNRRRQPAFSTFQMTRIPLFVWLSDSYAKAHSERVGALKENKDKYFTNDLAYELMCGIFDIESNKFDHTASIADKGYRFTREELLTYEGRKHITEDNVTISAINQCK